MRTSFDLDLDHGSSRNVWPYVGIDLTAGRRASDLAGLDARGATVIFGQAVTDDEIAEMLHLWGARIVAIDSPMGLPAGLCCLETSCACAPTHPGTGRSAERALAVRGIACFWTTKRTIIKAMVYRAIALKARLEEAGYTVLEVFPYASKRVLLGRRLPRKNLPAGIECLVAGVRALLPGCAWPDPWAPGHDQLDALFCAMTARLYVLGETEELGETDEVPIVVPRLASSPAPDTTAASPGY
jgi:predicted nuclease with RNAse H fold